MSADIIQSKRIFADKALNEQFGKYGYVVLPLLQREEIEYLSQFYFAHPNPFKSGFHTTHFTTDKEYKQKIHHTIISILASRIEPLLPDYAAVFGNFMVKEPGGNNPVPLHADWTYVDETTATSLAIWLPLVNITPDNGQLGVVPYSQHLSWHIRGPRILQWEFPFNETLRKSMGKLLSIRAGEAVFYNHRLLHYSLPNNSNKLRVALNLSLAPKNTQLIHYTVPEGKNGVHRYEVDDPDFFIYYDNFQTPERGRLTGVSPEPVPMLNERVDAFIRKYTPNLVLRKE